MSRHRLSKLASRSLVRGSRRKPASTCEDRGGGEAGEHRPAAAALEDRTRAVTAGPLVARRLLRIHLADRSGGSNAVGQSTATARPEARRYRGATGDRTTNAGRTGSSARRTRLRIADGEGAPQHPDGGRRRGARRGPQGGRQA